MANVDRLGSLETGRITGLLFLYFGVVSVFWSLFPGNEATLLFKTTTIAVGLGFVYYGANLFVAVRSGRPYSVYPVDLIMGVASGIISLIIVLTLFL